MAATRAGFSGGRSSKEWIGLSRKERAKLTSDFMAYLRENIDEAAVSKLDPGYAAAYGFKGADAEATASPIIPRAPGANRANKVKREGPTLKAMPRIKVDNGSLPVHDRLPTVRAQHNAALTMSSNTQVQITEGFVYIVSNPAWPDHVKIGSALDYEKRLNTYQTGDPHRSYTMVDVEWFANRREAENKLHHLLLDRRTTGEWFEITLGEAVAALRSL